MASTTAPTAAQAAAAAHPRDTARVAALVGLAGLAALLVLDALLQDSGAPRGDELIYELMARDPFATHTFPFAYRVAVPTGVHALPFHHATSFSLLGWLCSAGAGAALFALLERLELPRSISVPTAIALAISPVLVVASIRQGRSSDPLSVLIMCAGGLCIVARAPRALAATVLVGALQREAALFLVPWAYAHWAERWWDPRALRSAALAALPGACAYVALRLALPTVGREQVIGYGGSLVGDRVDVVRQNLERPFLQLRRVGLAFGPLWLFALLALRDHGFARRALILPILCVGAATFALDWGRIAALAAPAVCGAAALALRDRPRWVVPTLACWYAAIAGYALYMRLHGFEHGIADAGDPVYPVR